MNENPIQNRTLLQKALTLVGLRNWASQDPPVFDPRTLMTFNINDFPFSKATNASSTNTVTGTSWQTILSVPDNEYWLASYVRADKWDGTWTYTAIGYYSVESGLTIQMEDFAQTGGVKAFRQRLAMGPGDGLALYVDAHSVDGDAAMSVAVEVFSAPT